MLTSLNDKVSLNQAPPRPLQQDPPERVDDLFTQALPFGRIYPGAQIRGFVYFSRVDPAARRLRLRVGYAWEGQGPPGEMLFTFAAESATGGGG